MDLTKLTQNEETPIVVTINFDVDLFVKGYHEYKSIWTPKIGETLSTFFDGMQVSCTLNFVGQKKFICILQKTLKF